MIDKSTDITPLQGNHRLMDTRTMAEKTIETATPAHDKRTRILDAAQKRFAHFGLSKTTMDDVAGDLGISKAALYYYFNTKEEIFREVTVREQEAFLSLAQQILAENSTAVVKFRDYCRQRLAYVDKLATLNPFGVNSWQGTKPVIADLMQSFSRHELAIVTRILDKGNSNGEFSVDSVATTAGVILHAVHGLGLYAFKKFTEFSSYDECFLKVKEETAVLIDLLVKGLSTGTVKSSKGTP